MQTIRATSFTSLRHFDAFHMTEIELHALSRGEAQEVIYRALRGHASLPVEVRARIEETAEGNPLFIEELLRSAIDSRRKGQIGPLYR